MTTNQADKKLLNRNYVARAVFNYGESMGLREQNKLEWLTNRVIEYLERQSPMLPGMEELVVMPTKRLPSIAEVQAAARQILATEKPMEPQAQKEELPAPVEEPAPIIIEEAKPVMETNTVVKAQSKSAAGLKLSENAIQVLEKRYLKKDKDQKPVEKPEDMFRRVAATIASAELLHNPKADTKPLEEQFYQAMINLDFLPNSPTLMNAGRDLGQLAACFVLPVEDTMESIFDAVKYTAMIHKSGGGTGFSFSRLRPEQDRVGSTGGVASGPVSFIRAFDTATDVIKQGGTRRGANMGILNVNHPDIMKFIMCKDDGKSLQNFNISVAVNREFMQAVRDGKDYDLINPHNNEVVGQLNAKTVFDKMIDGAWRTGDPGIIFIDTINDYNPTPGLGKIESTNPCGEQPLLPYESCNLGSINLATMVKTVRGVASVDYAKLAETCRLAVRFLDNVIDVNVFPLPQIADMTRSTRKIGLGVMGFADMLVQLGVSYDSEEALKLGEEVMKRITDEATKASIELAKERGVFPTWDKSIYVKDNIKIRNATRTTIAPTGTLSIIAGATGGIEPLFALSYTRHILDGAKLVEVYPYFEKAARDGGFYSEELMKKLADGAHLQDMKEVPDKVKRLFVTAHDINPEWHVKMQVAFQKSTNNAVSKTVNFPHEATREDVAKVYMMAFELGLKGITIYRDRSRDTQVLNIGGTKEEAKPKEVVPTKITPRKRPKLTQGVTENVNTGCGHLYVTINWDDKGIVEVFSTLGHSGGCAVAQLESTCRLISLSVKAGVDPAAIVDQLRGIRCPSLAWEEGKAVLSCADAIATVMERHLNHRIGALNNGNGHSDQPVKAAVPVQTSFSGAAKNVAGQCPDCGNILMYQEGCFKCPVCGYTKC